VIVVLLFFFIIFSFLLLPKIKEYLDTFLPAKKNYRGVELKSSGGAAVFLLWFLFFIPVSLVLFLLRGEIYNELLPFAFILISSFAFGFLDDISSEAGKGFKGHLRLLIEGKISSGILKLFGIGFASLFFYSFFSLSLLDLFLSAALISLCANFFNLLDLRPGRCIKFFLLFDVLLILLLFKYLQFEWWLCEVSLLAPSVFVLWYDLREKLMLGDSGSNMLGVWIGASIVIYTDFLWKLILFALLLLLNLLSEFTSFTYWIGKISPLRWFDSLGRMGEE
jgi:hypothetical protein